MNNENALNRLNLLLPLLERLENLDQKFRDVHHDILINFSLEGKVLKKYNQEILETLNDHDLIVLDDGNRNILGAYPFSLRETQHHISNEHINIHAMCALDALAISPVFNIPTTIQSRCYLTNEEIKINLDAHKIMIANPSGNICIGIRWQQPGACAADNLCMEMIFLRDEVVATKWQGGNNNKSIFSLPDAINFAYDYFSPLVNKQ